MTANFKQNTNELENCLHKIIFGGTARVSRFNETLTEKNIRITTTA